MLAADMIVVFKKHLDRHMDMQAEIGFLASFSTQTLWAEGPDPALYRSSGNPSHSPFPIVVDPSMISLPQHSAHVERLVSHTGHSYYSSSPKRALRTSRSRDGAR